MLKLMYITNNIDIAQIAQAAGVDSVFVDMEYIGKLQRQGGMDTVKSNHTIADIKALRPIVKAELLVRCNPIHDESEEYISSKDEIEEIVQAGADIIMLPYFKTKAEVEEFIRFVDGRTKTMLLVETPEAVENIDDILSIEGIDEIHIGLNDLSLGYEKKFMFELLADGTVEMLCDKFKAKGIPYGFGGIASLGKGQLPAENVIAEHYRLGSSRAILSRSFCNVFMMEDLKTIEETFTKGIKEIREYEEKCSKYDEKFYEDNKKIVIDKVKYICGA